MNKKLAINGGKKTITLSAPHFIWPPIDKKIEEEVIKQLYTSISIYNRSGIIKKLEEKFVSFFKRKYALLFNSGTTALYGMYVGAGLKEGDEVICPAYTFFATVTPLFFTGAIPILADCDKNGNISPEEIKKKITPRTKAIVVTHMWGIPCQMDKIKEIAQKHNLMLLEDCSHAHGAEFKGQKVGTFGKAAVFSLHAQKTIPAGEGGVLVTDDEEIYYKALLLGHYNKRAKQEIPQNHPLYKYAPTGMGLKLRIHPLAATIASSIFDKLEDILKQRREFAQMMIKTLEKLPGITPPSISQQFNPSWYAFIVQYNSRELGDLDIIKFYKAFQAEGGIEIDKPNSTCPLNFLSLFQKPEELFPKYKNTISYKIGDFPQAEKFHQNALKLPVWHQPRDRQIVKLYLKIFKKLTANYQELI